MKTYPLFYYGTLSKERTPPGLTLTWRYWKDGEPVELRAVKTGVVAVPLMGEVYLDERGFFPVAKIASCELDHPHHLMKIVACTETKSWEIVS